MGYFTYRQIKHRQRRNYDVVFVRDKRSDRTVSTLSSEYDDLGTVSAYNLHDAKEEAVKRYGRGAKVRLSGSTAKPR